MARDKHSFYISHHEGSSPFRLSVEPTPREFIIFVAADGSASLCLGTVPDADGVRDYFPASAKPPGPLGDVLPESETAITISRFEGNDQWRAAIMPRCRKWIVYVTTDGIPHQYDRVEDVTDPATGDTRERYVLVEGVRGPMATPPHDDAAVAVLAL